MSEVLISGEEPKSFKTPLSGYLAGRSVALAMLLPLAAVYMLRIGSADHPSFTWFFAFTAAAFAVTFATALLGRHHPDDHSLLAMQPAWDLIYCTQLVYLSGGAYSPFIFLFLLVIIGAATLFALRGAVIFATVAAATYGLLCAFQLKHLIRPLNPFLVNEGADYSIITRISFHIAAFYAVALLSGYLAEELRKAGERLIKAQDEILDLTHLQAAILQSMGSGLLALDEKGQVMFHNQSAENLLRRAGFTSLRYAELFDLSAGDRHEVKIPGATPMVLGYSVFPLSSRDGRLIGKILTFIDLTQIRKLEEELKHSDRMAAIGRLAAGLAHEIRNPLASLSGSVQMLKSDSEGKGGEQEQLFSIVLRETDRLNHLVTDFLGYARPGEFRFAAFGFKEMLEEVGLFFTHGEGRQGFRLLVDVPEDLMVTADKEQMGSLFLNLLRNSTEAAPQGVVVSVTARQEGGFLEFTVADDGPGMPPAIADRAFEPFVSSKSGGTGLGLATIHRIVKGHGGVVSFHNGSEGGLVFRIRLPIAPSDGRG